MESGMKKTGWILLGLGALLLIIGIVASSISFASDYEKEKIATERDFEMMLDERDEETYQYRVDSSDAMKKIIIEIESKDEVQYQIDVDVVDPFTHSLVNGGVMTTPISLKVDISDENSEYWFVILKFADPFADIGSVSVRVYGDTISGQAAALCCMGSSMLGIGGVLLVLGIIFTIVGVVRGKKKVEVHTGTGPQIGHPPGAPSYQQGYPQHPVPPITSSPPPYQPQYRPSPPPAQSTYQHPAVQQRALLETPEGSASPGARPRELSSPPGTMVHPEETWDRTNYTGPDVFKKVSLDHERTNMSGPPAYP